MQVSLDMAQMPHGAYFFDQNFGVSFSIISIITGIPSLFHYGLVSVDYFCKRRCSGRNKDDRGTCSHGKAKCLDSRDRILTFDLRSGMGLGSWYVVIYNLKAYK